MDRFKSFLFQNLYPRQIVLKNAFWLYASEALSKGFRFLIFFYIARTLGPQNFGLFEYLLSFVGAFFLFADFGVSTIFIRDYQQKENKEELINNALILKFFLSFIFALLALFGYFFAKKVENFFLYLIFVLFYFLVNLETFFESFFIALQKTEKKFLFSTFSSLILFLFVVYGLLISPQLFVVAFSYLISIISGLCLAYFLFQKETSFSFKINLSLMKNYLYQGLPLALFGLLGYIFFSTDKIILAYLIILLPPELSLLFL